MKKKGFTLIELLAVIVILAIIALIITPIISDLIESSRYASAVDSVLAYVSEANQQVAVSDKITIGGFENYSLELTEDNKLETGLNDEELSKINYKGKGPTYVYLHFDDERNYVKDAKFCMWGFSLDYDSKTGVSKSLNTYCDVAGTEEIPTEPITFTSETVIGESGSGESGSGESSNCRIQQYTVPVTGIYKLEVWGAQGASCTTSGKGGYVSGYARLTKDTVLGIMIGTQGTLTEGGCNGGGNGGENRGQVGSSGGGATHIAVYNSEYGAVSSYGNAETAMNYLYMVAGGGGGCPAGDGTLAGHGGGTIGTSGYDSVNKSYNTYNGHGATNVSGGATSVVTSGNGYRGDNAVCGHGAFGRGGNFCNDSYGGCGGGGGFYGGGGSTRGSHAGGGGGSSYINSGFFKTLTMTGVKEGNGAAKITFIGKEIEDTGATLAVNTTYTFDYNGESAADYSDGSIQTFVVPATGIYKLEAWGASGGNSVNGKIGGYGAYATGNIKLYENQVLYIGVGGTGIGNGLHGVRNGGYNGGGTATSDSDGNTRQASGGGATHFAYNENLGELKNYSTQRDEVIMVAAGGGSASGNSALNYANGGHAGGFKGSDGEAVTQGSRSWYGVGASATNYSSFGAGANAWAGGGGGGYYGGFSSYSGGGGTSYIGYGYFNKLYEKGMFCYNCAEDMVNFDSFTISTTTGSLRDSTNCPNGYSETPISKCAKKGNGYAKITFIGNN